MTGDDQEIVVLALKDASRFGVLVEKYEMKLDSYLRSILYVGKEDREDLIQEIFIAAYRYLNSYRPEYSFSTWLYRIAHNQAMSFLRKHKSRLASEQAFGQTSVDESTEDPIDSLASEEDVEKDVENLVKLESVKEKMKALSPQDREVLVLRYCEEQEYKDIASILRLPEGTVASIIHRAKNKLKKLVQHDQAK